MASFVHLPTLGFIVDSTRGAARNMGPPLPSRVLGHHLVRQCIHDVRLLLQCYA